MRRSEGRRLALVAVVAVALAAVGGWWIAGRPTVSTAEIGHDRAVAIARDYFASADAHGAGSTVSSLSVTAADLTTHAGRDVWEINIHGDVTEPGRSSPAYTSHMWLWVDAETGAVTVFAQG